MKALTLALALTSYTAFLTKSLFTTLLCLVKSAGTVFNLSKSNLLKFDFKLAK